MHQSYFNQRDNMYIRHNYALIIRLTNAGRRIRVLCAKNDFYIFVSSGLDISPFDLKSALPVNRV